MCVSSKPPLWTGACRPGGLHSSHFFTHSVQAAASAAGDLQPAATLFVDDLNPASRHLNTSTSLAAQGDGGEAACWLSPLAAALIQR